MINNRLSPEGHNNETVRSIYNLSAHVRQAFTLVDEEIIKKVITSFIRPTLEYVAIVWKPHLEETRRKTEKVQRAATRCVITRDASAVKKVA